MIAALILIPLYMLFVRDDGSGGSSPEDRALIDAARDPANADAVLVQRIGDHAQGISVRYPVGWKGQLADGAVRIATSDGGTAIAVTSAKGPGSAKPLFRAAADGVFHDFQGGVRTYAKNPAPISGLPSAQAIIKGTVNGEQRTALVSVARGRERAYIVTVLAPADGAEAGVANLILARGLSLSG